MNFYDSLQANISGWNGKALAHMMGWFGEGNPVKVHRQSRYVSNDPATIAVQLDTMLECGIDGVIITWQGPTVNTFLHDATMKIWEGCLWRRMHFGLLLDPWIAKHLPSPTQAVIAALQHPDTQRMLNSQCYVPENFVLEFDLAVAAGVNIDAVATATGLPLLSWHTGFSWPNIPADAHNPVDSIASLKSDNAKPTMKVAGVNIMFNDGGLALPVGVTAPAFKGLRNYSQSVWGNSPVKVIDHQGGNWFYDQLAVTPATIPYIALVTWNDHDEGTGIEHVISAMSGSRI